MLPHQGTCLGSALNVSVLDTLTTVALLRAGPHPDSTAQLSSRSTVFLPSLMLQVLLKSQSDREVVVAKVDAEQTAAVLKACVVEQKQLDPEVITQPLTFNCKEVPDSEQLSKLGLVNTTASIKASGSQLFPNGWFESPFSKAFTKVQDITWPPLRQADFDVSLTWVVLLLALLLWTHQLLT